MLLRPFSLRRYARMMKRVGRLAMGNDVLYRYDIKPKKVLLGTVYGGWTVAPEFVDRGAVTYSFGVGNDISFDSALITSFGVDVHGFDPSPPVVEWISTQKLPAQYVFHPYGLGAADGYGTFYAPRGSGMYSVRKQRVYGTEGILPVCSLGTIAASLETSCIDILKIDIEGAEYDVIPSVIDCQIPIKQLLIEFHHRLGIEPLEATVRCVQQLKDAGFLLFHVSETSSEFSFLHNRYWLPGS